MSNLFSRLFKYSESENLSPLENFTTELLAYVLKYDEICNDILEYNMNNNKCIKTQTKLEEFGKSDILITTNNQDKCFIIENKIEAGFQPEQLSRYREYASKYYKENKVIVITKYSCEFNDDIGKPDKILSWFKVSEKLRNIALHNDDKILHEFIKFLEDEKMALNKVNSLEEKQHFLDMIEIALDQLQDPNLSNTRSSGSIDDYNAFNYYYKSIYISIIFTHSDATLYILIHDPQNKYNNLPRYKWKDNAIVNSVALNNEDFFTQLSSQQFDKIKTFLKDGLHKVNSQCMGGN